MTLTELFIEFKGDCDTLVETGTHHGAGVLSAIHAGFESVLSFEIDAAKVLCARDKFKHRKGVCIHFGSSSEKEFSMVPINVAKKAVFWLDAHKMGPDGKIPDDYPLKAELEAIGKSRHNHTVLIDDVRLFGRYGVDIEYIKHTLCVSDEQIQYRTIRDQYPNDVMCVTRD